VCVCVCVFSRIYKDTRTHTGNAAQRHISLGLVAANQSSPQKHEVKTTAPPIGLQLRTLPNGSLAPNRHLDATTGEEAKGKTL
jgi:hypothetical protein